MHMQSFYNVKERATEFVVLPDFLKCNMLEPIHSFILNLFNDALLVA